VLSSYFMHINYYGSSNKKAGESRQREIQKKIDQPLLLFYAREFNLIPDHVSSLSTTNFTLA